MNKSAAEISEVINSIRELSGVGICYYDLENFFNYNKHGVKNNKGHYCSFCEETRGLRCGRSSCEKSDRSEAVILAKEYKEPFFFECHMGIRELVIPLLQSERLIGILFVGQCRIEGEEMNRTVKQGAERLGGDPEKFEKLYKELPLKKRKDLLNVGKILSHYFDMKILNNELVSPALITEKGGDLANSMNNYINANYNQDISAQKIAKHFFVNPSYASRCFSAKYHVTVTEYIHNVRIERAKILLSTTTAPINNIALNVGFSEANYFSRIFKKVTGITPNQYRTENK